MESMLLSPWHHTEFLTIINLSEPDMNETYKAWIELVVCWKYPLAAVITMCVLIKSLLPGGSGEHINS